MRGQLQQVCALLVMLASPVAAYAQDDEMEYYYYADAIGSGG